VRKKDKRQTIEEDNHGDDGERKTERQKSEAHVRRRNEGAGEETRRGDIKSGDLPSCGEMADHRRVIREPNTLVARLLNCLIHCVFCSSPC